MKDLKKIITEKFDIKLKKNQKIDAFKYFFGQKINNITTLDSKDEGYAEHNFSGLHSASNESNCDAIVEYIKIHYPELKNHCDIGGSIGTLSKKLIDLNKDSYVIEGHDLGLRNNSVKIPLEKYCVFDITASSMDCLNLEKYFDLTTTFEVTEHIPVDKIDMFYENCKLISKSHICSVHHGGESHEQNVFSNHYNVKSVDWWVEFLSKYGKVTKIDLNIPTFGESSCLRVDFY